MGEVERPTAHDSSDRFLFLRGPEHFLARLSGSYRGENYLEALSKVDRRHGQSQIALERQRDSRDAEAEA
jgi:hypothetical protein